MWHMLLLGSIKAKSQLTTSLLAHLRSKHPRELAEAESKQVEQQKQNQTLHLQQPALSDADV